MTAEAVTAVVDGVPTTLAEAALAVTDAGVARGDGAFETIGVWDGAPFRLDDHLARLDASLAKLLLPPADADLLRADLARLLAPVTGDAALRCYVTASGTRVATLSPQPSRTALRHLVPQYAPWVVPPAGHAPAGAKTMSYAPNMTATRAAQRAGGDDALLVTADGTVLEGPTFCVLWVVDGVLCAVAPERGIVDSISRRSLLALAREDGVPTRDAEIDVAGLGGVDEVLVCSSVRPVTALAKVGAHRFDGPTPVADALADALADARRGRR